MELLDIENELLEDFVAQVQQQQQLYGSLLLMLQHGATSSRV